MNRNLLTEQVNEQFSALNRLARKVVINFEKEVLSDFRIAVQKLRAFLHLLSTDSDAEDSFKIRRRLKSFYGYSGIIRNIELQLNHIGALAPEGNPALDPYVNALRRDMDGWKEEAISMLTDHDDFNEERNMIIKSLPGQLARNTIRRFVADHAAKASQTLCLRSSEENCLHEIRKLLKDIQYNWQYVEQDAELLMPRGLNNRDNLQSLTILLTMYGEQCAALDLLKPAYLKDVTDQSGLILLGVLNRRLEKRKDELKIEFYDSLLRLRRTVPETGRV